MDAIFFPLHYNKYLKKAVSGIAVLAEDEQIRQQCQAREDFEYWERIKENGHKRELEEKEKALAEKNEAVALRMRQPLLWYFLIIVVSNTRVSDNSIIAEYSTDKNYFSDYVTDRQNFNQTDIFLNFSQALDSWEYYGKIPGQCENFCSEPAVLEAINNHYKKDNRLCVLHGISGSGKTLRLALCKESGAVCP